VTTVTSLADGKPAAALLSIREVAALLNCSARHLYRLVDSGRAPGPLRLGALVRWPRKVIDDWIGSGCPPVRALTR
jgi:excisionase family DNA binding protein